MALEEYSKKRSFNSTPEPEAKKKGSSGPLAFMVHKHDATRLHYDLRLELDGVLLSWAVPKGPSLNPTDKRLAMHVEDHPLDYKDFEGVIPKGNYGAGTVMIWDEGTYTDYEESTNRKTVERNLRAGLEKGDFKFRLNGRKIKGAYVLAKIKSNNDENAWLLIKKKDEYAAEEDVTKRDYSVRSNRTMDEIAAGKEDADPDISWAPKAKHPGFVKPMLASLTDAPFDKPDWWYEIKWDGYRIQAHINDGKVKLFTRKEQDYTDVFRPVAEDLRKVTQECVLDGEVVVVDKKGRSDFGALQNYRKTGQGNLIYYVFDCIYAEGRDLRGGTLHQRKEMAQSLIRGLGIVKLSDHIEERGTDFFKLAKEQGLEGIIAKDSTSTYVSAKRTQSWLKIKTHQRQEAVIGGWTEPRGGRQDLGSLILGVYEGKDLHYIGHSGGGMDDRELRDLYRRLKPLERKTSPFSTEFKTNAPAHWVNPKLVCEASFSQWTSDGIMRQPVYEGLREDKDPKAVIREKPTVSAEQIVKNPTKPSYASWPLLKTKVELSNLDKIYFPSDGITKGDVVRYYDTMSDIILPYLMDRPESMNRHPNGIEGDSFYQKDLEHHQPWVRTVPIYSESNEKDINWLVCNDRDHLLYMANLGCIELNPWHSRIAKEDNPDYCLIDLDAKTCTFAEVIEAAKEARKMLDEIGVASFPKTSGKTGLHICIPLGAKYNYEQSRMFAQILTNMLHDRLPKLTSIDRSPTKRRGKIYLDYLQNRKGQTMAAPYCIRPVPGATVSTPLKWSEVRAGLDPRQFTVKTIYKRLEKVGDLWVDVVGQGIDLSSIIED